MEILGIGPLEFLLILIIMLIILGPNDMVKAGRSIGTFLRKLILSDEWRIVTQAGTEFRNIPDRLVREAGLDDIKKDIPTMDDIKKEIPTIQELTAQAGIPELTKGLEKDFGQVVGQSKQSVPVNANPSPASPATAQFKPRSAPPMPELVAPPNSNGTPVQHSAPAASEPVVSEPAPSEPAASEHAPQPAAVPEPQKPVFAAPEPQDELEDEIELSPWVTATTTDTSTDPLAPSEQEKLVSTETKTNPTQS